MLKDILLPLKTRRIKDVGSKQPGDDKEPTAESKQKVRHSTTIVVPICNVNYEEKSHFKPASQSINKNSLRVSGTYNNKPQNI